MFKLFKILLPDGQFNYFLLNTIHYTTAVGETIPEIALSFPAESSEEETFKTRQVCHLFGSDFVEVVHELASVVFDETPKTATLIATFNNYSELQSKYPELFI
jgi:hypothetical protein